METPLLTASETKVRTVEFVNAKYTETGKKLLGDLTKGERDAWMSNYIAASLLFHHCLEYFLNELEIFRHSIFVVFMIIITVIIFFLVKVRLKHKIDNV
ncbi:hypothetical protein H4V97_001011 [Flavobacterium sp. CG_23.5]|uniref:hypothetical protein n=1 Tax=unclassified Flavobacterium TaxID=196869 RepID=UPI0018C965F6|nr:MULTISPECIES: hypothetical protein [unclassified Flavobacterium]MBG6111464.1 hypothetical protein [Flavobacterium sp. CG_9.10]MBP2282693.1 hypothetical protein [Flavobacterium sp. CG_23.5]